MIVEQLKTGFSGLLLHKLRTGLTMLGVIFGVAAVLSMVAVGEGAKEEALRQIQAFGARTLYVNGIDLSSQDRIKAGRFGAGGLCLEDSEYLLETCPFIARAAPQVFVDAVVSARGKRPSAQVVGVDESYAEITGKMPYAGRFISESDVVYCRNVCVLGWRVARELFVDRYPVGADVLINGRRFVVTGVMPCKSVSGNAGKAGSAGARIKTRDVDRDVYVPLGTALSQFQGWAFKASADMDPAYHRVRELILEVRSVSEVLKTKEVVSAVLTNRHGGVRDFEVMVPLEIIEQSKRAQNIFNLVLACIAGLSLLVGGIGIMNIMLANVTERTREIGIRRSVGATRRDIMIQFLIESTAISFVGGLFGLLLGLAISSGAGAFLGWEARASLWAAALALSVSVIIGVLFGIIPARSAARLDPVEALRY